jgi:uncharacterized protein YdiU (UPF0061 family)
MRRTDPAGSSPVRDQQRQELPTAFEGVFQGSRWEMQLKGGGPTHYCRGADERALLRSSMREFLAQEFVHALGVPTSRSLTLVVSRTETVRRPW